MSRITAVSISIVVAFGVIPIQASVYSGIDPLTTRAVSPTHPAGTLFPGVVFGDSSDHFDGRGSVADLQASVTAFVREPDSNRSYTVASLYGEAAGQEKNGPPKEEEGTTIPVVVRGDARNQEPIKVFMGTDTSGILSQLFEGLLDVDEETFEHRRDRRAGPATARSSAGGGSTLGGSLDLTDGRFLVTQALGSHSNWLEPTPLMPHFDGVSPVASERAPVRNSELLKFVLGLLNPYFYGALFLLLLFSIAWSLRSRFMAEDDTDY